MKPTALLLTLLALAPVARGQDPVVIHKSATNGHAISTTTTVTSGGGLGGQFPDFKDLFDQVKSNAQAAMQEAMAATGRENHFTTGLSFSSGGRKPSAPALLTTRPLDAATRAEWTEDLRVMDKLLRDQMAAAEGDAAPHAMGIRIWTMDKAQSAPTFVEDFGVLFYCEAAFPLAASPNPRRAGKHETPPSSAWDRARKEIQSNSRTNTTTFFPPSSSPPPAAYDAAKVEELVDMLAGVLAEARNIRHLAKNDTILVTVSGVDSAGAPARLTLKASRGDLESASGEALSPAELRKRLKWSIQ